MFKNIQVIVSAGEVEKVLVDGVNDECRGGKDRKNGTLTTFPFFLFWTYFPEGGKCFGEERGRGKKGETCNGGISSCFSLF